MSLYDEANSRFHGVSDPVIVPVDTQITIGKWIIGFVVGALGVVSYLIYKPTNKPGFRRDFQREFKK